MKQPVKILLSAGMIQGGLSGVGRYVVELANRMRQYESIELHLAGFNSDRHLFPEYEDARWLPIPDTAQSGIKNVLWHQLKLPNLLKQRGYDLLHIPSYRRILAFSPIPQLVTIHDCAPFRLRDKYGLLRGLFGRQLSPWLARRCDSVIAVSQFTKQDLIDFFKLPSKQIVVVHNGLSHTSYYPQSAFQLDTFRAKHGLKQPYLIYVSRLEHPGKNHVRLIEAYEAFRQNTNSKVHLVLGGAPWHGADVIQERVAKSPFAQDILLPGFMDEAELPLWYAGAEALVFPSLIEGFGLPVVEALACGVRVVSSNSGSLPEVGGDAAIYFDPESIAAITAGLQQLHTESAEKAQQRIQAGLQHAATFDWDLAAKLTCQSYFNTLNIESTAQ
ncbi:glycosyltransferase family 1 protein [Coraliomargarita sp. SDUM461004]|uniref:Glycosyltransferase family 1 protein n=1 Tax=Thalassobacterium sedimentorum TaxID=3041258 RepID=A0ABU1AG34_9BACT|nr:glycosyltransferase family 1 protein [Coraliomargarita sp. SDUM461004]MDQ8193794.1 glycosyltransferase family 1 protein [Coraliomargarita sp. SDUM461004]